MNSQPDRKEVASIQSSGNSQVPPHLLLYLGCTVCQGRGSQKDSWGASVLDLEGVNPSSRRPACGSCKITHGNRRVAAAAGEVGHSKCNAVRDNKYILQQLATPTTTALPFIVC